MVLASNSIMEGTFNRRAKSRSLGSTLFQPRRGRSSHLAIQAWLFRGEDTQEEVPHLPFLCPLPCRVRIVFAISEEGLHRALIHSMFLIITCLLLDTMVSPVPWLEGSQVCGLHTDPTRTTRCVLRITCVRHPTCAPSS